MHRTQILEKISTIAILLLSPMTVFAAPENFAGLLQIFINIFGYTLMLVYVGAILFFIVGIAQFILNTDDEGKREEGKKWMLWSIIALFVGITLWGIVNAFVATFGGPPSAPIPQLPE
ncbi:pilin [bacterium]|nr:pilin [bacterium]